MASDSVACPACGARNRTKWEFCARCGEALQTAAKTAAPARASKTATAAEPRPSDAGVWASIGLIGVLVAVGIYYGMRVHLPATAVTPNLLGGPPSPPAGQALVDSGSDAGSAFFREG